MTDFAARLRALDSCAVSDALDALGLPPAVAGIGPQSTRTRIAGRAVTVKLGRKPPEGGSKRHLCTGAIEVAETGDVIVVEQSTGQPCAGWGGVLSTGAKLKGLSGVIVEGPARDIDEAIGLEFPVYARSVTAVTARGRVYEQDFNVPVRVGGVDVSPGDYLLADSSGIAVVPAAQIEAVLEKAELIARKEALMVDQLRQGVGISEVMGKNYETMLGTQK